MTDLANSGHPRGCLSLLHVKHRRVKRRRDPVAERVRRLDELAASASVLARVSTHGARRATRLAIGVCVAMVAASASAQTQPRQVRPAADALCTPVLLCPQVAPPPIGGAGTGGRGGMGGGGAGGRGGGGGGTGGTSGGGVTVSAALTLDRTSVAAGQTLAGEVTYGNATDGTIIVPEIRIAARAPGATHAGGPYTDLAPVLRNAVIPAHGTMRLQASRVFTAADPLGRWEAYSTYQDTAGVWRDAPSVFFDVVAASGGVGGAGGGVAPPTGEMTIGTQEWFIASWSGATIWRSGINWATAYSSGAEVWRPEFLAELAGYAAFRHMDTNATNFSKITKWSQRKLPTDPDNAEVYIDGSSSPDTTGMAIEWQIDLCNRGGVDCWFTHPLLADDDYLRQQATLIKSRLASNRRVYIELSNEVWNGAFSAQQQAIDRGVAGGLPGGNEWYKGIAWELHRALAMYQVYAGVFGAEAMGQRVIRVFSESGNLDLTTQALRNVYGSSQWNPHGQKIDMIGLAPYIGSGVSGASETLARWRSEVDAKVNDPINYVLNTHAKPYSIPLLGCYEAGMHHLSSAASWAQNPDVYEGYTYMLDRFASKMNAPCMLYTLHGTWEIAEGKGAWGAYNNVGQPIAQAHKARAARDWIAASAAARERARVWWIVVAVLAVVFLIALAWVVWRMRRVSDPPTAPPAPPAPTLVPPSDDGDGGDGGDDGDDGRSQR